jgi:hypothetical protein
MKVSYVEGIANHNGPEITLRHVSFLAAVRFTRGIAAGLVLILKAILLASVPRSGSGTERRPGLTSATADLMYGIFCRAHLRDWL